MIFKKKVVNLYNMCLEIVVNCNLQVVRLLLSRILLIVERATTDLYSQHFGI